MADELIDVEVAYATEQQQVVIQIQTCNPTSILEAIQASGLLSRFPEINLNSQKTGIFGQLAELSHTVHHGDRIEIYRPLKINPMDARRQKARNN